MQEKYIEKLKEEIAQNKDIIFEGINHYYNSMDN